MLIKEKNENVFMQALRRILDVVLVQILRYDRSETDYSFCEDSPFSRTQPFTWMRVSPSALSAPTVFFALPPLWERNCHRLIKNVFTFLARRSVSTERKHSLVQVSRLCHLSVGLSGKCILATRLSGSRCLLGWSVGSVEGCVY